MDDGAREGSDSGCRLAVAAGAATARRRSVGVARRWCLVVSVVVAGVLLGGGSALALTQRGHVFSRSLSFGGAGTGDGQLNAPAGVAVSESTGDVYVVDRANDRIERFGPDGRFLAAWGWGVSDGKKKYEVCTSDCRAGRAGNGRFELSSAEAIAVDDAAGSASEPDPSAGDVYVEADTAEEHEVVDKFSPDGGPLGVLEGVKEAEKGSKLEKFEALHGLTVAPGGTLWVYDETEVDGFSDAQPNKLASRVAVEVEGEARPGVAVGANGDFYVGHEGVGGVGAAPSVVAKLDGEGEALIEELDGENTTAVAVDRANDDVYLDNGSSLAVFDAGGSLVQRFGGSEEAGLKSGAGVAVDSSTGDVYVADSAADEVDVFTLEPPGRPSVDDISVEDVTAESAVLNAQIDPDGSKTEYYFEYCVAGGSSCVKAPAGRGIVGEGRGETAEADFGDEPVSVELQRGSSAPVLPGRTYEYRVIAENEHGEVEREGGTFTTQPAGGVFTADGRGWELVSPPYRGGAAVEAISEAGGVIQASWDGQAITYVSNAPIGEAEGSRSFEPTQMISTRGPEGWSSQDIVTPNEQGMGFEFGAAPEYQFFSRDLSLALLEPFLGGGRLAEPPLSPPVSAAERGHQEKTIYLRDDGPISPEAAEAADYEKAGEDGDTAREDGEVPGYPGYLPLVTAAGVLPGAQFGGELFFASATPDLSHVVVRSTVALTPGSAPAPSLNLYEWAAGTLQLVNVLPGAARTAASGAELGSSNERVVRHAISDDGSRVFWTVGREGHRHLYMRDMLHEQTIQLDEKEAGASGEGYSNPVFQTANTEGSRVFFVDEARLTEGSGASREKPDLYELDIDSGRLTDLTRSHAGESANVQGVLGASEDGSTVYFVANGVLGSAESGQKEAAVPGRCRRPPWPRPFGARCNLYVEHYSSEPGHEGWEEPRLIAILSNEDGPDWEASTTTGDLGELTSRVSPDGGYLAFMSDMSLTGYDNRDASAAANGARDEEVFLYDAGSGRLVCASCDPSGARPLGVLDPQRGGQGQEGIGLLVDRPQVWDGRWLAGSVPGWTTLDKERALYQSRYLSDSGRLFFDSPGDLVPEATNAREDVYEYEPEGVPRGRHECTSSSSTFSVRAGGCVGLISSGTSTKESAFLDASENGGEGERGEELQEGGGDVFFLTAAKLVPQDAEASFAVYDAHECTSGSPCLSSPAPVSASPCESTEACRPASSSPTVGTLAIATTTGSGNLLARQKVLSSQVTANAKPPTRAQKLANALKACRRLERKKQRASCEAQARRRYGAQTKTKKPAGAKKASRGGSGGGKR